MAYDPNNIFAKILRGELPAVKIWEDDASLAILDLIPQSDGHTLIIPKAPAENIFDLEPVMAGRVMCLGQRVAAAARRAFQPEGVALMQFNGAAAGQTVFHFHLHVIPRYAGQPLRTHERSRADPGLLALHAARLKAALESG